MSTIDRVKPGKGQESVWDYPRPPKLELSDKHIEIYFHGERIAESRRALRILETSHPPVYYLPAEDIRPETLIAAEGGSWCEWKGRARYYDVVLKNEKAARAAWTYPSPTKVYEALKGHFAFYAWAMDRCLVNGEVVIPQPGRFYGGWITPEIVGPFKGEPGSMGW